MSHESWVDKPDIAGKDGDNFFSLKSRIPVRKTEVREREVSEGQWEQWRGLLRQLPVSINNYYGDPVIQWDNTISKLEELSRTKHAGPVGIIMKGRLTKRHVEDLKRYKEQGLAIVCLISISELKEREGVGSAHRYDNIEFLNEAGVPAIAYVRPLMPPFNTSEETVSEIFEKLKKVGCKYAVTAGFRGDEQMVNKMQPDEKIQWSLRVKVMPGEIYQRVKKHAIDSGVQLFTRTSCAVSAALGDSRTYNPYYNSRELVKCADLSCPLQDTCAPLPEPRPGSIDLVRKLGYDVEFFSPSTSKSCGVSGEDRLKCPSCCTTCYFAKNIPRLEVRGKVNLGDLTFIRFVTGVMAMQPGHNDDGSKDVGRVRLPEYGEIDNIQALNSWWPMARNIDKCFGCKYCIVDEYYQTESNREVGFAPALLIDRLQDIDKKKKIHKQE